MFTWEMTAPGAAMGFFERGYDRKLLDWMLGAAAGVMIFAAMMDLDVALG
jgi:zinc transporter, ZIP family